MFNKSANSDLTFSARAGVDRAGIKEAGIERSQLHQSTVKITEFQERMNAVEKQKKVESGIDREKSRIASEKSGTDKLLSEERYQYSSKRVFLHQSLWSEVSSAVALEGASSGAREPGTSARSTNNHRVVNCHLDSMTPGDFADALIPQFHSLEHAKEQDVRCWEFSCVDGTGKWFDLELEKQHDGVWTAYLKSDSLGNEISEMYLEEVKSKLASSGLEVELFKTLVPGSEQ